MSTPETPWWEGLVGSIARAYRDQMERECMADGGSSFPPYEDWRESWEASARSFLTATGDALADAALEAKIGKLTLADAERAMTESDKAYPGRTAGQSEAAVQHFVRALFDLGVKEEGTRG